MPKSLGSTESTFNFGSSFFANTVSSDSTRQRAIRFAVGRSVLHAVGDPEVRERGLIERLAEFGADLAAADAVFDPEFADRLVPRA